MYQPDSARATTPIGTISINPAWGTACMAGYSYCRYVDAMLVQYNAGITHSTNFIQTSVVGTTASGNRIIGSLFTSYGVVLGARMMGDSVYKTGYWTGTTRGVVVGSCVTLGDASHTFHVDCTDETNASNSAGDSGGPVYYWRSPLLTSVRVPEGISWGQGTDPSGNTYTLYCNYTAIQSDLGLTITP